MASISYWIFSPSLLLAAIGKLRGWDRTKQTPGVDWQSVIVDVAIPAKNEASTIAFCLASVLRQDFPIRKIIVFDDASSDGTADVVLTFREATNVPIELGRREVSIGKTPSFERPRGTGVEA